MPASRSLRETESIPEEEALKRELKIGRPIFASEDAREGPKAFAQKRKPDFERRRARVSQSALPTCTSAVGSYTLLGKHFARSGNLFPSSRSIRSELPRNS